LKYIYAVLLLHDAGKEINEENLTKIFEAIGENPDKAKIRSLVSSLKKIDINEVLQKALEIPTAAPAAPAAPAPAEEAEEKKEEEKKEEEEKEEEEAFEGLSALFG
jgi:large subunit ribosomal protein L12